MGRRKRLGNTPSSKVHQTQEYDVTMEIPHTPERFETSVVDSIIKTPPFSSRGGRTSPVWDEYHSLEYFDINPKTDYTYAHSVSYNPSYLDEPDIIPNMSRHRINSHASGYSLHTSGFESPPPYSSGSRRRSRMQEESIFTEEQRMEEEERRLQQREQEELRRSRLEETYHDDISHGSSRSRLSISRVTYKTDGMVLRSGSRLSGVGEFLERNNNRASSSSSVTATTSQTSSQSLVRSLNSEFEEVDSSQLIQHSTPLSHLYGLDSDDDGDVGRSTTATSSRSRSSYTSSNSSRSSESVYGKSQTWMQLLLTTITTVFSLFTDLFRPITDSDAYRRMKIVILRRLRVADMWIVSRRLGGCCLCLPLLLLLPLLLGYMYGGELLEQARASVKSYTLLSATSRETHSHIHHTQPLPHIDPSTINVKIQQFFDEHKHRYELSQLSEEDVKRIAQSLISSQLGDLKLALLQDINQIKGDQIAAKTSQHNSIEGLDNKLADFIAKYKSIENDIAGLRTSGNVDVDGLKQDYQAQINNLELQMKTLGDDLSNLQISHLELLANVRNCCKNDSFYAMAVRKHVQDIFAEMMAGGGGGDKEGGYAAFLAWLQSNYARKEDMDKQLVKVSEDITQRILAITKEQASSIYIQSNTDQGPSLSEDYIRWIVDDALQKFSADQVGMADYALESAGGSVLSVRCSETYYKKTALVSVFGIPLWYTTNSARTVIQPDVHPGQCWAFKGARGFLVIQLAFPVKPSGFTLEHIPKALSPTGNIDSAPKNFAVFGLSDENDKVGVSLGNYTYADSGKAIQYFPIQATTSDFFEFVELKVLGNHGNPEYTCLYRFRVHGMPYKPT